jgi:polysaccharide export outer membrane protein
MKSAKLLLLTFMAPAALCLAQNQPASAPSGMAQAPAATAPTPDAALPAPPPLAAGVAANNYIIGASDVLMVTVWKDPTFSGSVLVRPDGMISIPLLGDIQAAGSTPIQLKDVIAAKLRKYIQDPQVSVILTQVNSKKIYLIGEINKKGPVEMTPGMTLLEAISSGGGLTDYAKTKKMYILRDENGNHQRIPVNYKDALKGNSALNVALHPGDTIVVP